VDASPAAMQDYFEQQGWTDGLPVVPPIPDLVAAMVEGSGLAADTEVAAIAPSLVKATVEKIAINAVMAGCRPDYMPVIIAALRALAKPAFNLAGVQATTHPVAPLIFLNGPVRHKIGLNCGSNVFGQGFRTNATIGRAIRLVLMNIGQGIPGKSDMATHGTPCKFSFCGGENEEESPWEPFHVECGKAPGDSMVTVHAAESPHNVQDHASSSASELLLMISDVMMSVGSNNMSSGGEILVALGPEHARILARDGMSKDDVRTDLFRRMRLKLDRVSAGSRAWYRTKRRTFDVAPDVTEIPYLDDPKQILIVVAGGPGLHSLVIPSFGISYSTRESIDGTDQSAQSPAQTEVTE
jgi:hypothetical protein